jgi:hypothetical protein
MYDTVRYASRRWMGDATDHRDTVLALIRQRPGISDRELEGAIFNGSANGGTLTPVCRELASAGVTRRKLRPDSLLGNWLAGEDPPHG